MIKVKEILVFNRCHSDDESAAVYNYLNQKWDMDLEIKETPLIYTTRVFFEKGSEEAKTILSKLKGE